MQNLKKRATRLGIFSVFDMSGKHTYAALQNLLPAPPSGVTIVDVEPGSGHESGRQ